MTFPALSASHTVEYWPDYDTAPQVWLTAGSLSDKVLVASVITEDIDTGAGEWLIRTYSPAGDLIGSANHGLTGWRPLAPCRVGDGVHLVQAFAPKAVSHDRRFICYDPLTGDIAWDTTATTTDDQYYFWTHDGIAYFGNDVGGSAIRFDATTGTRLADAPATYGEEDQDFYTITDVLDFQYVADEVITVPSIGPFTPGYVMASQSWKQAEGGGVLLTGAIGGYPGGIVFGPSGRTALGVTVVFLYLGNGNYQSVWLSVLTLGAAVTPPLRKIQRSDGLAMGAPRRVQTSTIQSSNRRFGIV